MGVAALMAPVDPPAPVVPTAPSVLAAAALCFADCWLCCHTYVHFSHLCHLH